MVDGFDDLMIQPVLLQTATYFGFWAPTLTSFLSDRYSVIGEGSKWALKAQGYPFTL